MTASLSFVQLTVRDLDAALAWYRTALGLSSSMREADSFALLSAGATRLALKKGTPSPGGVRLAFEVANLTEWVRGFVEAGGRLDGAMKVSAEGYRRVRVCDADGYEVSVFEWIEQGTDAEAPTN